MRGLQTPEAPGVPAEGSQHGGPGGRLWPWRLAGLQKGKWLIVRQADKLKSESVNQHSVTLSIFLERL